MSAMTLAEQTRISAHVVDAFREQEIADMFGFFFISSIEPDTMVMSWAYGNGADWTAEVGIALLERVIAVAEEALAQAKWGAGTC